MKLPSSMLRHSLLAIAVTLSLPAFRAAAQTKPDASQAQADQSKAQPGLKPLPQSEKGLEAAQEGPEFLRRRQDWFFQPRAFPIGFIPQGARERALQQKKLMYQREGRFSLLAAPGATGFVAPPSGTSSAWFSIGPRATSSPVFAPFTSGRVTALAVNPNNANNAYLGGADGGLWVSTDGGTTWTPLAATENPPNTGIPTIAVGSLALDTTTCNASICTTVYVGTGEDNFGGENIYGEGVLKCTVTAGAPPTATCTQDSTFHLANGAPLDDFRGGPMIGALTVNPKLGSNGILLAGVRGRGTAIQSGIYCSADAGVTWIPVFGISGIVGTDVAFAGDGTAYVALGFPFGDAANNGIYKSKAAITTSCTTDPSGTAPSFSPNWIKQILPAGTPAASLGRITLAIFPSASSTGANATIYAAIADSTTTSSNLLGVIKTTNGGTTPWTQLNGDPHLLPASGECNSQCFYDMPLAVSPAGPNDVFFGGAASKGTLIRSTDGGLTWTEISRNNVRPFPADSIHVDMHAIAFSGNGGTMYVGNDGGVWKTTNPTLAGTPPAGFWTNLNQNLDITQFYPGVSIHPSNTGFSMGGTQDNDVQIYQGFISPSANLSWNAAQIGCDGGFTAIDFNIPSTSYGECEYIPNSPPFPLLLVTFAGDGILGNGFLGNTGINASDRGSFIPPFVMDPTTPTTLYFGTCRIWKSLDAINSWTAISPDITAATHPAGCGTGSTATLSTIAPAPSNSNTVYTGADNGEIQVTADGGTTWTSITTSALPGRSITQIVVDPNDNKTAYVTFSGFGSCAVGCTGPTGHVFQTVNSTLGAATVWTDIDGAGLPDIPVNAIAIDPADSTHNTLYVGTDIGAFFTSTGGTTWSPLGAAASLPNAQIQSLTLHNASRTLRAATHGRGVWDLNLGGQAALGITSIVPFTAIASPAATDITNFAVSGNGFTASSVVKFTANGITTSLTPSCPTANSCTATIPAAQLQNGALAQVTVANASLTTNAMPFTVLNPVPGITSISPTSTTAGVNGLSLTVNGGNFLSGANKTLVLFNQIPLPASAVTVQNSTTLTVQVPAGNLTTAQVVSVDTFNPQPGGGPDTNPAPPTLTITGGDFTLTPQAPTSVTVSAGSAANYTVAVGGVNGFTSSVNLSCTLPAAATYCTVTPSSAAPGISATVKVTTTARAIVPPTGFRRRLDPRLKTLPYLVVAMLMLALLSLSARTRRLRLAFMLPLATLLAFVLLQATGCGGSYSPPPATGTPAGTYTVTVTGTSGGITHSTTVTLVVN